MSKIIKDYILKQEITEMPQIHFSGRIIIIDTTSDAVKAVNYLNSFPMVGVDTETRPSFKRGVTHKVGLLQVATDDICFLFRLCKIGIPNCLHEFLENDVLKIGLSLKDDFSKLRGKKKTVDPSKGNWLELQQYVLRFGIKDMSLQKIYANLFQMRISKTQRLSNWEVATLTEGQQLYAATDAWCTLRIYEELKRLEEENDYELVVTSPEVPIYSEIENVENHGI